MGHWIRVCKEFECALKTFSFIKKISGPEKVHLTSEAARLSPWQPAALQAAHQCARPRTTTKTTTHIGNYAHSYTNKTYQKKRPQYTSEVKYLRKFSNCINKASNEGLSFRLKLREKKLFCFFKNLKLPKNVFDIFWKFVS